MLTNTWIETLFGKGRAENFSAQEIFYEGSKSLEISVYEQQVDKYSSSETAGVSYRAIYEGKVGYAYTEHIDDDSITMLVNQVKQNAQAIEVDDEIPLHDGSGDYKQIDNYNPQLAATATGAKIKFMLDLEQAVLAKDTRIRRISQNAYSESEVHKRIINTRGLDVEDKRNICFAYASIVAEAAGDTRTGMGYSLSGDFHKLDMGKIVNDAAEEALSMLKAKAIPSCTCPVIFKNETFAELFSAFNMLYSAESVQKNLSHFKDKLHQQVAVTRLTLMEDPHLPNGIASMTFDDEGVATQPKAIIENGILKSFLYNLKTAKKAGKDVTSTGNASKASYKASVGIAPSNTYLQPGEQTFNELVATIDKGVYITSLHGLHAGLEPVSGNFSLQCQGYEITDGTIGNPISQITVSGNFFELLHDIDALANDTVFTIMASNYMGSPSVKVGKLSISGE